ncbi:MAG: replication-associated recombination protein A [Patescibacteria group bacterium]|nr:replication-associated recombination protein A [Patescibacteria group bacterium]
MIEFYSQPWADKVRPQKPVDIIGQEEILGEGKFLLGAVDADQIPSTIFWGPPGSGKTSLANVIAKRTNSEFVNFSAAIAGVGEVRKIISKAEQQLSEKNQKTILFIDEIHRFNKRQQDVLLPHVEKGTITLIGATTENPSFEINSALLSRTKVFVLKALDSKAIKEILEKTLKIIRKEGILTESTDETARKNIKKISSGIKEKNIFSSKIFSKALDLIASLSNGDARVAINALQLAVESGKKVDKKLIQEIFQKSNLLYDKAGEEHFNLISALHKSMRGGDVNAALYWLMRMIEGGEDPLYIARRLVRFASEDVGIANNSALMLAISTHQACHFLGLPECDVHLAHCVAYLTKSAKSVSIYKAVGQAKQDVKKYGNLPVPLSLRNAPTKLMKDLKYGKGYQYPPDYNWQENQEYFPEKLRGRKYL